MAPQPTPLVVTLGDMLAHNAELMGVLVAIENVTTQANRVRIGGGVSPNYIWTENAADVAITMKSDSTGFIGPNDRVCSPRSAITSTGRHPSK